MSGCVESNVKIQISITGKKDSYMNWKGKKVLVVGCGISGIGATELLEKVGASPVLFDENTKVNAENVRK